MYKLLSALLDASLLSLPEAFGYWKYNDINFLRRIAAFVDHQRDMSPLSSFSRSSVLALIAYMFAGAEDQTVDSLEQRATIAMPRGVVAKLTVISQVYLGNITNFSDCEKFALLDVDTSCIPCNTRGIIMEGASAHVAPVHPMENSFPISNLNMINLQCHLEDFTTQIEPDWGYDCQKQRYCVPSQWTTN